MPDTVPAGEGEEARLAAALERIARAGERLRGHAPNGATPDTKREAAARLDALIAEVRTLLGTGA